MATMSCDTFCDSVCCELSSECESEIVAGVALVRKRECESIM